MKPLGLTEGYQKLVKLMLDHDWLEDEDRGIDDPAPGEYVLKNGMSFCRWTGTPAGYRIYQAPGRDMTVVAQVNSVEGLVMELMMRGAL